MRTSGVLMPISSLPSPYGIGTMGKSARKFVDFLVKGGQTYWQILPICPTSYGDSPYQSFSSFAGNPYFIDLDILCKENLLKEKECESFDWGTSEEYIDYGTMYVSRYALLHKAYARFVKNMPEDFSFWVEDQIAVMSPVTIAVAVVVTLAVLAGIWLLIVSAAKKDVRNTSEILAGVEEVNQGYEFYDVDEEIRLEYPLESLEEFKGASLDKLFMSTVRKKIPQFEEVFGWAQSNVIQFAAYKEELKSIPNWTEKDDDCGRRIPFWLYWHQEQGSAI